MAWAYNYRSPNQMSFGRLPSYTPYQRRPSIWQSGPTQYDVWAEHRRRAALQPNAPPQATPVPTVGVPQVPIMPPIGLPEPYPRWAVSDMTNQIRAQAAQAANLPYLMKRYTAPGVSQSAATAAMAVPEAISALGGAEQQARGLGLSANEANAAQRLAGGALNFWQALGQAEEQARLQDLLNQYNRERQGYALAALTRGPDPWALV